MQLNCNTIPTMEYSTWKYIIKNKPIYIIGIYHPPPTAENATTNAVFPDDLIELLIDKLTQLENIILLRDFNIHIEETTSPDTVIFNDTMGALGLTQHITQPTYSKGNILDLVFMEVNSKIKITGYRTSTPLSDHYSIIIDTNIKKNKPNTVTKTIRDMTKLSPKHLMESYTPPTFKPEDTIDQVYNQFKEELIRMLDAVVTHTKNPSKQQKNFNNPGITNTLDNSAK